MTINLSKKSMDKRVKFLLNSVHISYDLAKALKWRQLYKLLKKAAKLNDKFDMPKKELKELSKQIVSVDPIESAEAVAVLFNVELKQTEEKSSERFEFIPFEKPYIEFFMDKFPLLLI